MSLTARIKIVPKASPNADSREITVKISPEIQRKLSDGRTTFRQSCLLLAPYIPADSFMVAVSYMRNMNRRKVKADILRRECIE